MVVGYNSVKLQSLYLRVCGLFNNNVPISVEGNSLLIILVWTQHVGEG